MLWCYDGTFEGFLSAVAHSYRHKVLPDILHRGEMQHGLFDSPQWIRTDPQEAFSVLDAIRSRLGRDTAQRIFHAHLCDDSNPERELLLYIRMGLKDRGYLDDLAHPVIYTVEQYQKRVLSTLHRLHAFTRFEQLSDLTLYARIAPPRNVLPLMGPHFRKRFGEERFIIHDTRRTQALLYADGRLDLRNVHAYEIPKRSADEARFQQLWKRFFDTVAIEERCNPVLQRQTVPLKYREFMTEFMEGTAGSLKRIDKS